MVHTALGKPGNSIPPLENSGILITHPGNLGKIVEFVEINIAKTFNIGNIVGPYKLLPVVYLLYIS